MRASEDAKMRRCEAEKRRRGNQEERGPHRRRVGEGKLPGASSSGEVTQSELVIIVPFQTDHIGPSASKKSRENAPA